MERSLVSHRQGETFKGTIHPIENRAELSLKGYDLDNRCAIRWDR
jgi:hypothetical protein